MTTPAERPAQLSPLKRALLALDEMQARLDARRGRERADRHRRHGLPLPRRRRRPRGVLAAAARRRRRRRARSRPTAGTSSASTIPIPDAPGKMLRAPGRLPRRTSTASTPQFFGISPREAAQHGPAAAAAARGRLGGARGRRPGARPARRQPHRRLRRDRRRATTRSCSSARRLRRARRVLRHRAPRTASPPAGSRTCSACRARAWRSTRPARRRWSRSTWPARACAPASATWRWPAAST